jgi:hypothetical protein
MSIWDDPDMKVNNDFIKFENPGDTVTGTIVTIRPHRFDDGSVAPQILLQLQDGTEKTLTAGQVRLKALLAQERPEAGERITITYTNEEKRSGGKTLKHFDVTVHRGALQPALTTAAPVQDSGGGPDPQALAAAVANLTPEQKAALGIPA